MTAVSFAGDGESEHTLPQVPVNEYTLEPVVVKDSVRVGKEVSSVPEG